LRRDSEALKKTPLSATQKREFQKMNTNTKYWSLTWDTNIKQKKLPNEEALLSFFDRIADECVFQYEKGTKEKKLHIQGTFTLTGKRQSKSSV
jgi:hypothetical protein